LKNSSTRTNKQSKLHRRLRKLSTATVCACISLISCLCLIACQSLNSQSKAADEQGASSKDSDESTGSGAQKATEINLKSITSPSEFYEKVWTIVNETFIRKKDIAHTLELWRHRYDGKLETMDDAYKAVDAMLGYNVGEPNTHLGRGEEQKTRLGGIGVRLAEGPDNKIYVVDPIYNGNAWKAGVKSGYRIDSVDDKPVAKMTVDEIVAAIRGPVGSKIKMSFFNGKQTKDLELVREEIAIKATRAAMKLHNNLGYISLDSLMPQSTPAEIVQAVVGLKDTDGLILDLRDNTGTGKDSFLHAVDLLNTLSNKKGIVAKVVDSDGKESTTSTNGKPMYEKPVAVLVNKRTGKTAELVAYVLHWQNDSKLVGERTAGDCYLQTSWECPDDRTLSVTTGYMLGANGEDWHRSPLTSEPIGIVPDVEVVLTEKDVEKGAGPWWYDFPGQTSNPSPGKNDKQLAKAMELLTSKTAEGSSK
jgi:Periplasmic protease